MEEVRVRSAEYDFADNVKQATIKLARADFMLLGQTMREMDIDSISGPQVDAYRRVIGLRYKNDVRCFYNPIIKGENGFILAEQVDERFPDQKYVHIRSTELDIDFTDKNGETQTTTLIGRAATEFQKHYDILDGVLLCDFGKEWKEGWREDDSYVAEFLKEQAELIDEMNKNEEVKKILEDREKAKEEYTQIVKDRMEEVKQVFGKKKGGKNGNK